MRCSESASVGGGGYNTLDFSIRTKGDWLIIKIINCEGGEKDLSEECRNFKMEGLP